MAILFISHDLAVVRALVDTLELMRAAFLDAEAA